MIPVTSQATRLFASEHLPESSRHGSTMSYGLFPLVWGVLCVVVPAWVTPGGQPSPGSLAVGLTLSIVLYAGTRIALIIARGSPAWLPFMFWSFAYIWIGLAMYAQDLSGRNPYNVPLGADSQERACVMALVGMVCFDLGGTWSKGGWSKGASVRTPSRPRIVSKRRTIVLVVATLVGVPFLVQISGGWALVFTTRAERDLAGTDSTQAVGGIISSLIAMAPLVASASLLALLRSHSELRRRPAWLIAGGLCIALALSVTNPVSTARFISGTVLLGLLFSLGLTQRASSFRITSSFVFLTLLLVFPFADLYRYAGTALTLQPLSYLLTSKGDYDTAVQMVASIDFRETTGGTGGEQILGVLGFFIPRTYWADKPGATGALITDYLNYPYANVSSPLWVEAYVDGGYVALIAVFIALGYFMTRASDVYSRDQQTASIVRLMVPLVAAYSLIVMRGSLLSAFGPLVAMLVLGWLVTHRPSFRANNHDP